MKRYRDFYAWQCRAVYLVQCYTANIARTLPGWHRVRVVSPYKHTDPTSRGVRQAVAAIVRQSRRDGLTRREVARVAKTIIANPRGLAVRVDIDQELARFQSPAQPQEAQ